MFVEDARHDRVRREPVVWHHPEIDWAAANSIPSVRSRTPESHATQGASPS